MLFNSWVFAAFFVIFFPVYLLVRRHIGLRNLWILLASYVFYGWWNPRFVTLLAILAAVDYLAALGVAGQPVRQFDRAKAALFTMAVTVGCAFFSNGDGLWLIRVVGISVVVLIGGDLAHRPGTRGEAQAAVAVSVDLRQPRRAGLLQVRQLLHRVRAIGTGGAGHAGRPGVAQRDPADRLVLPRVPGRRPDHRLLSGHGEARRVADHGGDLPGVLPAAGRRPDRARPPPDSPVRARPAAQRGDVPQRRAAVPVGAVHEGGRGRQRRAHRQPGLRAVRDGRWRHRHRGHPGLHRADLLRFRRLLEHGPGPCALPWLRPDGELQPAVLRAHAVGVLAALAHQPVHVAARLPVRGAWRQPRTAKRRPIAISR